MDCSNDFLELQKSLESLCEESYDSVKEMIKTKFLRTKYEKECLAHFINCTARFRPFSIPLLVRLVTNIEDDEFKNIIFDELNGRTVSEIGRHFITYCLLKEKYFNIAEIVKLIEHYMETDIVPLYDALYIWFAPELKEYNEELFAKIQKPNPDYLSPELESFWNKRDELFNNDFELLKKLRDDGLNDANYIRAFLNDDVQALEGIDLETEVSPCCYDRFFILQSSPKLIHLAAYFNAVNCFNYLISRGADLESKDGYGRTVPLYAFAGGSEKIIPLIDVAANTSRGLLIATSNHRNNIFDLLSKSLTNDDLLANYGSILHQACGTNNVYVLLECIKKNYDINKKNSNDETPLHYAAQYGHFDIVKILLSQKDIDVNPQNKKGETPLHLSIGSCATTTALALLDSPKINLSLTAGVYLFIFSFLYII